ncbi:hypothetical protein LX15_004394 [Streptoalloteichus tenebrarius]|uniref:Transposase n=1 Tax=Streptoalloteichus tenebrarius (strain ATCC 17920 / DSM 40477 / JCM 4838 / CBS 697.72 / NBRC 16177 / NCIMB 11028 / NRRL B-12390 / A12253. 1 / ISP 5477) TaxID=1933 RepID=A0ABT1HYT0_STRSD|nr:hypothetical protein [Streptoalloteichus tenebrarius]BFF03794.1 hypothetical protein GCM10020241_54690 [Streptoalloteichus tenebrarius]
MIRPREIGDIADKDRTGVLWREVLERFDPWQTLYERLSHGSADCTRSRLVDQACARAGLIDEWGWVVSVDSSLVRAHQHSGPAR